MFPCPQEFQIPSDWIYRGEGNCNVVISLPKQRKILRIRKIKKARTLLGWLINWITDILYWYCGNPFDEELRDLIFYKRVMRPLIGHNYVCNGEQVFLSRKQIRILEEQLYERRPGFRRNKCLQYGRAALFDDYAFLPEDYYPCILSEDTFAIEIKPKQGFAAFGDKVFPKCIYCMNQYLKLKKGQIKSQNSYCPLDMFSGESDRTIKALNALIENPQNNLKIFKNGQLYYGENFSNIDFEKFLIDFFKTKGAEFASLKEEFSLLIQRCLSMNFDVRANGCDKELFCKWNKLIRENSVQNQLPRGSVLERILSVQMLDVEGNQYYYKLLESSNMGEFDYVNKLMKEISKSENTCLKCTIMMLGGITNGSLVFAPYLMSAIAKDCSLMITMKKVLDDSNISMKNFISTKFGGFIMNVGVFDLYPKPISTIVKHRKKMVELQQFSDINF